MAIFMIEIRKHSEENNYYFYYVNAPDYKDCTFYIRLDPPNKKISFYKTTDFSKCMATADLTQDEILWTGTLDVPGAIVARVLGRAHKAMRNNEFPRDISYCA